MTPDRTTTPLRNIRVEDALWGEALRIAEARGETVSDVVRRSLRRYVKRYHATYPHEGK